MHSEDSKHANTPDFTATSATNPAIGTRAYRSFVGFRRVLIEFAKLMHENGISWDFQSDWNFTLGVLKYEIEAYTAPTGSGTSDLPSVSALLAESGGKNVYRYLVEDLGVQIDPHSHESAPMGSSNNYNYADVACLIAATGVTPSGIVGGHIIESSTSGGTTTEWQKWPRFRSALRRSDGHSSDTHVGDGCSWTATALMGGGTGNHTTEDSASGLWLPTVPASSSSSWTWDTASTSVSGSFSAFYFDPDSTGLQRLPAIGSYPADYLDTLIGEIEGTYSRASLDSTHFFNATQVFNHSDLAQKAYGPLAGSTKYISSLSTYTTPGGSGSGPAVAAQYYFNLTVQPLLDRQENDGSIQLMNFNELLSRWRTDFHAVPSLCVAQSTSTDGQCDPVSAE